MTKREKMYLSILETCVMEAKRELDEVQEAYKRKEKTLGDYYNSYNYYEAQVKQLQRVKDRLGVK